MADNFTISPNMGLVVPTIGKDPGPDWATNINADISVLDGHDHSPGSGVQITPNGININVALPFNDNNATTLRSVRFQVQSAALSGATDLGCIYVTGVDLYYNDENGNQIQITKGAAVNSTSSGISSGTASASFVAGVLVVNAAATTPANIQVASVLLGNNIPGSNFLTLSPPNVMASNYTITLPLLPASNLPMSIDNFGTITAAQITTAEIANSAVTDAQIATQTITQDKLAPRTTGTTAPAGGIAISASTGSFAGPGTAASCILTTTGRPVMLVIQPDGNTTNDSAFDSTDTTTGIRVKFFRDATQLSTSGVAPTNTFDGLASLSFIDVVGAGTYTYSITIMKSSGGGNVFIKYCVLAAYEL